MSEQHLENVCDHISHECNAELDVETPKVIYLETIRKRAEAEGKYIRQTGGMGNYAHVVLRLEPAEPGSGFQFCNEVEEGQIPQKFIAPLTSGIQEAAKCGILVGHEMVDLRAVLFGGSYHEEDSNEVAFKIAGSIAFKEAALKALPVVLEPLMSVEFVVPEGNMDAVVRELNNRRARIENIEHYLGLQEVHAIVPLAEMLQSSTHGQPGYSMQFARYEEIPRGEWFADGEAGVTAKRPKGPKPGSGSAFAKPDSDFE